MGKVCLTHKPAEGLNPALPETNRSISSFFNISAAAAKPLQSCPTLCDPRDGSPVPGILQARTLEWVAISFSNAGKWKVKLKSLSRILLFATPWTAAYQAPPSMGFSRQEYWSGLPFPSPGDLPHSGTEPMSSALAGDSLPLSPQGSPRNPTESFHLWRSYLSA